MAQEWELHDGAAQVGPLAEDHVLRMIAAGIPETTLIRPAGSEKWKSLRAHAPFAMALETRAHAPTPAAPAAPPSAPSTAQPDPPKRARRWFVVLVVLALCMCGLLAAGRAYFVSKQEAEKYVKKRRAEIAEIDKLLEEVKEAKEVQRKRIASAIFRSTRRAVIDGQCLGQGKPAFGYTIEGSTYADNVLVGEAMSCRAFGSDENNITNFFCCPRADLPAAPQVAVDK